MKFKQLLATVIVAASFLSSSPMEGMYRFQNQRLNPGQAKTFIRNFLNNIRNNPDLLTLDGAGNLTGQSAEYQRLINEVAQRDPAGAGWKNELNMAKNIAKSLQQTRTVVQPQTVAQPPVTRVAPVPTPTPVVTVVTPPVKVAPKPTPTPVVTPVTPKQVAPVVTVDAKAKLKQQITAHTTALAAIVRDLRREYAKTPQNKAAIQELVDRGTDIDEKYQKFYESLKTADQNDPLIKSLDLNYNKLATEFDNAQKGLFKTMKGGFAPLIPAKPKPSAYQIKPSAPPGGARIPEEA